RAVRGVTARVLQRAECRRPQQLRRGRRRRQLCPCGGPAVTSVAVGSSNASGLKWPNYVNGRLLTAQDLDATQDAVFTRDRWLGLAGGAGAVAALVGTAAKDATPLTVSRGVGVNSEATPLRWAAAATRALVAVDQRALPDGSRFSDCHPPTPAAR